MQRYLITVYLPNSNPLRFKVTNFEKRENRILFIDEITGMPKDYPSEMCIIEGIKTTTQGEKPWPQKKNKTT